MSKATRRLRFKKHGGRRKFAVFIIILIIAAAALVWLFTAGPLGPGDMQWTWPWQSGQDSAQNSALPSSEVTDALAVPTPTLLGGDDATATQSAEPGQIPTGTDAIGTGGAAILGNASVEDLSSYGLVGDADYYYKDGLTVENVYTETSDGGAVPIIEQLAGKNYDRIFLMFGASELESSDRQAVFDNYARVIATLREEDPNARIYIMAVLPITQAQSEANGSASDQAAIDAFNTELRTFASENHCYFMDLGAALKGEDGYLPADASADGTHLSQEYAAIWAEILRNEIGGEAG